MLRYSSLDSGGVWPALIAAEFDHLRTLTAILSAELTLEHKHEAKHAFHVEIRLQLADGASSRRGSRAKTVPALELHSTGADNTVEAALSEARRGLERQLGAQKPRRAKTRCPGQL